MSTKVKPQTGANIIMAANICIFRK